MHACPCHFCQCFVHCMQGTQTQLAGRQAATAMHRGKGLDPSLWHLDVLHLRGLSLLLEPQTGRVFTHPTAAAAAGEIPDGAAWPAPVGVLSSDGAHLLDADDAFGMYSPLQGLPEDSKRRAQLQVSLSWS